MRLTFKSKLGMGFSMVLAGSLILTGIVFSVLYFGVSLVNLESFVSREASEIKDKYLVIQNNEVFFRKDQGTTLASYLIDEGLSAQILDANQKVIGTYGIFRSIPAPVNITQKYRIENLQPGKPFLMMTYPITDKSASLGYIVLAANLNYGWEMLTFALILLVLILPLAIGVGWLAIRMIINKNFQPFEEILEKMKRVEIGTLSEKIMYKGENNDELVRLVKSYNEMLGRLELGVKKQKEFISNASHELKTPLTKAILELELIETDIKDKKSSIAIRKINRLEKDLKDYGDLLNGLLSIARIKEHKSLPTTLDLRKYILQTEFFYKRDLKEKKIKVVMDIKPNLNILIPHEHLQLLLKNIFSNAIKYSPKAGVFKIKAGTKNKQGYLEFSNSINKSGRFDVTNFWQRYVRGKNSTETGYGIGLSVVKDIASFNKMRLKIEKTDNQFIVRFLGVRW